MDRGQGQPDGVTPGIGITESVIGRMREVGGSARVRSSRRGTTVELAWSPEADSDRLADTWLELTRELTPMVIPGVVGALTIALLVLPDVANPALAVLSLVLFAVPAAWVVVHGVWLAPVRSLALLLTASIAAFAANVLAVAPDTHNGYQLFLAGGVSALLMLVAIQHRFRWSLSALLVVWGAMAGLMAARFGVAATVGPLAGALTAPFVVLGILLSRPILDRVVRRTLGARDQALRSRRRIACLQERHGAKDARLRRIRESVVPFLQAVVESRVDLADPAVRRQALHLEAGVRDELRHEVTDDRLAEHVESTRRDGWQVETRVSPERRERATAPAAALLAALGEHEPGTGPAYLSALGDVAIVIRAPSPAQLQRWGNQPDIDLEVSEQWCRMRVRGPRPPGPALTKPVHEHSQPVDEHSQAVVGGR